MLQLYSVSLRIYSWFMKYCHPKLASAGVIAVFPVVTLVGANKRPSRFWMSNCFDDSHWLIMNLGLNLVPLEAPWNYLSIHIKNIRNGLSMRPRHHFWCGLLLDSEVDSNLSCFGPPPWGLKLDNLWTFFLTWITLLVSFIFTSFTMFGRMHTCHVLIKWYLSSTDLSPSRTHCFASLKMSGMSITYFGYWYQPLVNHSLARQYR